MSHACQLNRPSLAEVAGWPPTITPAEAAPVLGISRRSVYQAISDGTFPAQTLKVGGRIHVVTASLLAVLSAEPPTA